jgi:hypothetical protein
VRLVGFEILHLSVKLLMQLPPLFSVQSVRKPTALKIRGSTLMISGAIDLHCMAFILTCDCSTKYIAEVQGPNQHLDLRRIDNALVEEARWPKDRRIQFLSFLKAENHFIQFLRPDHAPPAAALALGLYDKTFSIEETKDISFSVTVGTQKISLPKGEYKFQVVVPSDVDGEHGNESGIAKFAFLVRSSEFTFWHFDTVF